MKQSMRIVRGVSLLTAGIGLCLSASSAQAQRGGGRGGSVQSTRAATSTGQTGGSGSGMSGGCSNSSSTSSGTSSSTGTTTGTVTSGVSTQSGQVTSQSVGTVTAQRTSASSAVVSFAGSTAGVQRVYLAVLDANGGVVSQTAVSPSRAVANLTLNSSASYYGAMVVYKNGTSRTTYSPVR